MNKIILVGRLTFDPELRTTPNGVPVCSFSVAVDRRFSGVNGERQTDFINCVAWRQQAEFVSKYFSKGKLIGLEGSLQSRSYNDQQGNKRTVHEVVVDSVEFVGSKAESGGNSQPSYGQQPYQSANSYMPSAPQTAPQVPAASYQSGDLDSFQEIPDDDLPF